jgi:hypothetical protein
MRANEIEQKIISLLMKSKVFKRRVGKGFVGLSSMTELLEKSLYNPSLDTPELRKARDLLVQMCECPDAKVGWRELLKNHGDVIRNLNRPLA